MKLKKLSRKCSSVKYNLDAFSSHSESQDAFFVGSFSQVCSDVKHLRFCYGYWGEEFFGLNVFLLSEHILCKESIVIMKIFDYGILTHFYVLRSSEIIYATFMYVCVYVHPVFFFQESSHFHGNLLLPHWISPNGNSN